MRPATSELPDRQTLLLGLNAVLAGREHSDEPIVLLRRRHHSRVSSFPSQVVTCRLKDGRELSLLYKYGAEHGVKSYGHWGGIRYEAQVYHAVLQPLALSQPTYYGAYSESATGKTLLFIEYLHNCVSIDKVLDTTSSIVRAAHWVGEFHAANEKRPANASLQFLNRYDAAYYTNWTRRTNEFAGELHKRFRWLAPLCQRFEEVVDLLMQPPLTIIHGEFTMHNVLICHDTIYPVDWETAAIAIGEIDLALLTDGWPEDVIEECLCAYRQARWPMGAPDGFRERFHLAQVHLHLLWLGCEPERTLQRSYRWRYKLLRAAGERSGLL